MNRNKEIIKTSIIGIIMNGILVIIKAIIGFLANSIAITLDAINNLSDALSSIITIIGTKLSNKKPNKKHPYGYGRIEYFTSVIIAIIVLLAGLTALKESILKIITPQTTNYNIISLIVILIAVFTKFIMGRLVKKKGEELNSSSLIASGTDAISDSILSLSTFITAIISYYFHINLEGYLGFIIALVIIKTAIEILKDTINDLIGIRADQELTRDLRHMLNQHKEVLGVYDITIHNYGPNKLIGSAHIQLNDNTTAREIHKITRKLIYEVYEKLGIILTIGIYASNDSNEFKEVKKTITKIIKNYKTIIEMHGFYVEEEEKVISFDLIFDFKEEKPEEIIKEIKEKCQKKYPSYQFQIILDNDFAD